MEDRTVPAVSFTVEALENTAEGGAAAQVRVTATGAPSDFTPYPVYAIWSATGGTATYNTDFTLDITSGSYLMFPSSGSQVTVTVTPTDDSVYEGDETVEFKVQRYQMMPTGVWTAGTMTLADNEPKPVVSVAAVDDAVEGGATGTFRFTRTGDTSGNLTVTYTVRTIGPGLATPGDDYTALSGSVTILAGNVSADVSVAADDDETEEADEKVDVLLQTSGGYTVGDPMSAQVSIRDIQSGVIAGRAWLDEDSDGIQDEGEFGFPEVVVTLYDGGTPIETTTTNQDGEYSFTGVAPGSNYTVGFESPPDDPAAFSAADQGADDTLDSDANALTGITSPIVVLAAQTVLRDVGFVVQMEREVRINFPETGNYNYSLKLRLVTTGGASSTVGPISVLAQSGQDARSFVLSQLTSLGWAATAQGTSGISIRGRTGAGQCSTRSPGSIITCKPRPTPWGRHCRRYGRSVGLRSFRGPSPKRGLPFPQPGGLASRPMRPSACGS